MGPNNNLLTFFIDEGYSDLLQVITSNPRISPNQYQIIITPTASPIDSNHHTQPVTVGVKGGLLQHSVPSFIPKAIFLNHSQSSSVNDEFHSLHLLNHNLRDTVNDISTLTLSTVDLCLVDSFSFMDISVCNDMFGIPTMITMAPALISKAEYTDFWGTFLYHNDPFTLDFYVKVSNGGIMSYRERWNNVMMNTFHLFTQSVMARFVVIPMLENLNSVLRKLQFHPRVLLDVNGYSNGFHDFWDQTAIIGSLAPPFTPIMYRRPRVRQFGFLLSTQWEMVRSEREREVMEWVEREESPVLLISMGSLHTLSIEVAQRLYGML